MVSAYDYDLNQLTPPEVTFRVGDTVLGIAPCFSVGDESRYERFRARREHELEIYRARALELEAYQAAADEALETNGPVPVPPAVVERAADDPEYTLEMQETAVFSLLLRVWQASEGTKPETERTVITAESVRDQFSFRQALVTIQVLFSRRFAPRLTKPAPETPAPEPVVRRKGRRSSPTS